MNPIPGLADLLIRLGYKDSVALYEGLTIFFGEVLKLHIDEAIKASLSASRDQVIEECARVCEASASNYRAMKVDEDGNPDIDAAEAEEMAYCSELNAKAIRALKQRDDIK